MSPRASTPSVRCARAGAAAAHRPNAPSTWTQAPARRAMGQISRAGSNAPLFTLPACRQRIAGVARAGSASARMRPSPSTGTRTTRSRPSPSSVSALSRLTWTWSPTTTMIGGAPNNPCASTSHPARASTAWRAAASAVKFAIVAPVTNAPAVPCRQRQHVDQPAEGNFFQRRRDGELTIRPAFWSHAPASQFAATVTGSAPPTTKPKYRPPAEATVAGEPRSSRSARTASGSVGSFGSGPPKSARREMADAVGDTRRSSSPRR